MARKRTICVDFDGVIHDYGPAGWQGPLVIPGKPIPGAFEWLEGLTQYEDSEGNTFEVCIYSSRSRLPEAVDAMKLWFVDHGLPERVRNHLQFPTQKPPAHLVIDDRGYCFEGPRLGYPSCEWMMEFTPWWKK